MSKTPHRETSLALEAFQNYCLLGTGRSLEKLREWYKKRAEDVLRTHQKTISVPALTTLKVWSVTHNWQTHVGQYDEEQREEKRRKHQEAVNQMNERHVQIGMSTQLKMVKLIEKLEKQDEIDARTAATLLKYGTDLERLARGAPTSREEQTGPDGGPIAVEIYKVRLPDNGRDESEVR